jgi:hypothetical protein
MKAIASKVYWWVTHRVCPRHRYHVINTGLAPGYHDIDALMLHSCFSLLVRYVEEEKCFDNVVWDDDPAMECIAGEIEDLYHWWKHEYPKREQTLDALYEVAFPDIPDNFWREPTADERRILDRVHMLGSHYTAEENYNLRRLVSIKDFLWT